jgi:hypothetical protein
MPVAMVTLSCDAGVTSSCGVPKILAADNSRKRRWFACHSILATST